MTAYLPLEESLEMARRSPSVLFPARQPEPVWCREEPEYFADLNLDQLVESVIGGRPEYDLAPFFYTRLSTVETVVYRHRVLRDLEDGRIAGSIRPFADRMRAAAGSSRPPLGCTIRCRCGPTPRGVRRLP